LQACAALVVHTCTCNVPTLRSADRLNHYAQRIRTPAGVSPWARRRRPRRDPNTSTSTQRAEEPDCHAELIGYGLSGGARTTHHPTGIPGCHAQQCTTGRVCRCNVTPSTIQCAAHIPASRRRRSSVTMCNRPWHFAAAYGREQKIEAWRGASPWLAIAEPHDCMVFYPIVEVSGPISGSSRRERSDSPSSRSLPCRRVWAL